MVLVQKANNILHMCISFTNLNSTYHEDSYTLPDIYHIIDGSSSYHMLSLMDAYSGYNQIHIDPIDSLKTLFMSNPNNYYSNVMPFGLKNDDATYH